MRPVDADFVFRKLNTLKFPTRTKYCEIYAAAISDAVDVITQAPTISPDDVRGVIHCKDCKRYQPGEHFPDMKFCYRLCGNDGKRIGYNYAPEDFCSHGEKMEV